MVLRPWRKNRKKKQEDLGLRGGRRGFHGGSAVKNPPIRQEMWVQSLGGEDPLEEGMATHSSILAWRFPWTEEPGGLQSMGSQSWTWSDWARTWEEDIWVKCKGDDGAGRHAAPWGESNPGKSKGNPTGHTCHLELSDTTWRSGWLAWNEAEGVCQQLQRKCTITPSFWDRYRDVALSPGKRGLFEDRDDASWFLFEQNHSADSLEIRLSWPCLSDFCDNPGKRRRWTEPTGCSGDGEQWSSSRWNFMLEMKMSSACWQTKRGPWRLWSLQMGEWHRH